MPIIRPARLEDAPDIARVFISAWQDSYPGILPFGLLQAITIKGQTSRWEKAITARPPRAVLTACLGGRIIGVVGLGPARDPALGFDGEIQALYVDPACYGMGAGRALLKAAFKTLSLYGMGSCALWSNAFAQSRFFYEAMGAHAVAGRTTRIMGETISETAYGWQSMVVADRRVTAR